MIFIEIIFREFKTKKNKSATFDRTFKSKNSFGITVLSLPITTSDTKFGLKKVKYFELENENGTF